MMAPDADALASTEPFGGITCCSEDCTVVVPLPGTVTICNVDVALVTLLELKLVFTTTGELEVLVNVNFEIIELTPAGLVYKFVSPVDNSEPLLALIGKEAIMNLLKLW